MASRRNPRSGRPTAQSSAVRNYDRGVFINCPFDRAYAPLFDAMVFAVAACGFTPRSALEIDDASRARFDKIAGVVEACRLGIHDISRTDPDGVTGLPRFNMPLELGLFLGAHRYGAGRQAPQADARSRHRTLPLSAIHL